MVVLKTRDKVDLEEKSLCNSTVLPDVLTLLEMPVWGPACFHKRMQKPLQAMNQSRLINFSATQLFWKQNEETGKAY